MVKLSSEVSKKSMFRMSKKDFAYSSIIKENNWAKCMIVLV